MELRDLVVTPLVIIVVYVVAYIVRPWVTDDITRQYFLPALTVRVFGALAVGFIYQFYYKGGDTYNFHSLGSRHVWEAFVDSPSKGIALLFSDGHHEGIFYKYSSRIYFFKDRPSFFVIRIAAIFDLFTFSSYSATAVLFACLSFVGAWMLFLTFYSRYPNLSGWMAFSTLFIPSVCFWGSGLLKDTVVLSAIGMATFMIDRIFIQKKITVLSFLCLLTSLYFIFSIRKFVLEAFLPAISLWVYLSNLSHIRSTVLKIMALPFVLVLSAALAYFLAIKVGEGDSKYSLDMLAQTARITALDIRYQTGKDAGSGYTLGNLDGTFNGMLKLAPQAVNVSLFRPYLWEVKNPLMLLSALESLCLLFLTIYVLYKKWFKILKSLINPDVTLCIIFSIVFAFAVGVSTFNFGTLARYKIPLLPFYLTALIIMLYSNSDKNVEALDETE